MRILLKVWMVVFLLAPPLEAAAISITPFGANGEGGSINGQILTIGAGGEVYELDAFVNIGGQDLNGGTPGTSAQLSIDPLPSGLDFVFGFGLSADATDLTLSYSFTNNTGSDLNDFVFLSFVDADIDAASNTFFNEFATTSGTLEPGQNFEVDEPGYVFGDIFDNLRLGALDGMNAVPEGSPEDVGMALSFLLPVLEIGETFGIEIMLSEDGDSLGTFLISQGDIDPASITRIAYSGVATQPMPEPSSLVLFGAGGLLVSRALRKRRRGSQPIASTGST